MPRFSRISWKRRDDAEPPRIASSSDAAKRRRSERAIPGAPMHTWYCSVSLRAKRKPGGGAFTSGRRTRRVDAGGPCCDCARPSIFTSRLCSMFPAAAITTLPPAYICRWYEPSTRRVTVEITSAVPITGRPSAWRPNTASENRSCTSSCGVSSYIAISSSTTSRSESRSANEGANTMSAMTSRAVCACASGTRAYTIVCSREVAAFSSPPRPSKISAISCAVYRCEPLNSMCSLKCDTPALASVSSRDPAPIQKPIATERTLGTRSEITRSPLSSSERTYFCISALSWPGLMAAAYRFLTTWLFDAPREPVWDVIYDAAHWPAWWRGVERAEVVDPGDERGEGALWRSSWRSLLPYTLEFEFAIETVDRPSLLVGRAGGELTGTGTWRVYENELGTASTWEWQVGTTREWMNAAGPLGRPLFAWNHHRIMRWGGEGAARRIGCRLLAAS